MKKPMKQGWPRSVTRIIVACLAITAAVVIAWVGSTAGGQPANITVEANQVVGPLPTVWQGAAQGGEALETFLASDSAKVASLSARLIRIDHIFDILTSVSQANGNLVVDWSKLDKKIREITAVGATPFLSLSYLPPSLSAGDIVNPPTNWSDWETLVRLTIERYSGTWAIPGIYYEVWNEPDLFGHWKIGQPPDYLKLYAAAASGAASAKVNKPFFLGGPATTAPYRGWTDGFLQSIKDHNLRLDFYSWHRYSTSLDQFEADFTSVDDWFTAHPNFVGVQRIVSEYGISGDRNPGYDNSLSAAHLVAVVRIGLTRVSALLAFSLEDGDSPDGKTLWGDWGLLTGNKSGNLPKARYYAWQFLNRLGPDRLSTTGEGTFVRAISAQKDRVTQVLLVNYDPNGNHYETVPVTVSGIQAQQVIVSHEYVPDLTNPYPVTLNSQAIRVLSGGVLTDQIYLPPNSVALIEIKPKV